MEEILYASLARPVGSRQKASSHTHRESDQREDARGRRRERFQKEVIEETL